jgi:hypothetical protein
MLEPSQHFFEGRGNPRKFVSRWPVAGTYSCVLICTLQSCRQNSMRASLGWEREGEGGIIGEERTPWPESASELYPPSDRRMSAMLVPTFADRGCHVVSVTDSHGRILDFLDRSRYFFFQVSPQLYSRGWVDPIRDPLLLRKPGSAGNRTRTSLSVAMRS